jgi:hypothetical protein
MNSHEFTSFLELLSSTSGGEDGAAYYCRLHGKLEGFFTMKGICDPAGAADETVNTAVRRIGEGVPVPDVGRYCMGIARNIARERQRRERREANAFVRFLEDLDNGSGEQVERVEQVLRPCFELLTAEDRELLVAYCQVLHGRARAEHRRELALRMNTTVQALRMHVMRLRRDLADCVGKHSDDS